MALKRFITTVVLAVLIMSLVYNCVSLSKIDDYSDKIQRLDSIQVSLERILIESKRERDSLIRATDSISGARRVIIEKIKPVVVPVVYDGLSNKQLEHEMVKAFIERKK